MAKLILATISENVIVDSQSNMISIINVVERINTSNVPSLYPWIFLTSVWQREEENIDKPEPISFRIRIKYKSGKIAGKAPAFNGEMPAKIKKFRTMIKIQGIPIEEEGFMEFLIEKETKKKNKSLWKTVSTIPIEVRKVKNS